MADDPLPVGQLLRISSDRSGQGLGVDRQRLDTTGLADGRNWKIIETYCDNDRSAYKGRFDKRTGKWRTGRPEYERCLDDLRAGRIKGIVAYHPDRVFGHPRELEDLIDIVETTGAQIATVLTGSYDLSTAPGRFLARQLGAASRYEREIKAERHRRKHEELAQAGKPAGGGIRSYGFEGDQITVRESEAIIIREMADRFAGGESARGIAADLLARKVKTVRGAPWSPNAIRQILTSARIAGLREHRGDIIGDAVWPAIVDRSTWETCRRIFADPDRRTKRSARSYLLTGIAVCGIDDCGARLVARPTERHKRTYACVRGPGFTGCGKLRIMADPLEELVVAVLLDDFEAGGLARRIDGRPDTPPDEAMRELMAVERQLDELAEMLGSGEMNRRDYSTARARAETRRQRAVAALATTTHGNALQFLAGSGTVEERWESDEMTFDRRHAVLAATIDRVIVGPAIKGRNYFDPDRIRPPRGDIVWRV